MRSTEIIREITNVTATDDTASSLGSKGFRVAGQYSSDESADPIDAGDAGTLAINARRGLRVDLQTLISGEDQTYNTLCVIDFAHREIHEGEHFTVTDYDSDVDTGGPKYWRITAPNTSVRCHLIWTVTCGASGGVWQIYENPTISTAGTSITPINNDRNSATAATATAYYDTTVSGEGTLIWSTIIGSSGGASRIGGASGSRQEFILKQGEDYTIKFTPTADNTNAAIVLEWYEV